MLWVKTGRSPKRNTAQGNTLGERSLVHWRAVSAKGASEVSFLATSLCAYSAPVCWNIHTQGATLGYTLIGLSARLCDLQTFLLNCEGRFIVVLPPLVYFEMMYLVVENSINESNNESNRKHENVRVIKKNQRNAGILRKKVKGNEVQPLSYPSSKVKESNDVFRLFW